MNTLKIIIGCLLVAAPLIGAGAAIAKETGWKVLVGSTLAALLSTAMIVLGVALILGEI